MTAKMRQVNIIFLNKYSMIFIIFILNVKDQINTEVMKPISHVNCQMSVLIQHTIFLSHDSRLSVCGRMAAGQVKSVQSEA